jgi:DNA-binding IclR family transcriptional regulator
VTSPSKAFAVLDLFSSERPIYHADEICRALGYSRATGYRYVRDLIEAGFLQKVSAGHYSLGPRIIQLDYQLRQSDPVLQAAVPIMESLASRTGLDVVLSAIFGMQVVDTYRSNRGTSLQLAYGRGRPRPLFRGAAPRVLIAHLPRATLQRLYKSQAKEIAASQLGNNWDQFRSHMTKISALPIYLSLGEVERNIGAAAVPLLNSDGDVVAALSLVNKRLTIQRLGETQLRRWLTKAAEEIQGRLRKRGH